MELLSTGQQENLQHQNVTYLKIVPLLCLQCCGLCGKDNHLQIYFCSLPIPVSWWNSFSLHSPLGCPAQQQHSFPNLPCFLLEWSWCYKKVPQRDPYCMLPYLRAEQRLSLCYHQTNESKQDSILYAWLVIWPISTKWVGSTIHLSDEFRSKDNINFRNDYKAIICETFTLCIYFERRNSANEKKIVNEENELFHQHKLWPQFPNETFYA